MVAPKIAASILAISLFAFAPWRAQQPSKPPAAASGTGLLIAFSKNKRTGVESPPLFQYETWWIVRDATGAHVVAKIQDVIVPRKTGFWRVGIQHTCQFRSPGKDDLQDCGEISTEDIPYAVSIEEMPELSLDHPSCDSRNARTCLRPHLQPLCDFIS